MAESEHNASQQPLVLNSPPSSNSQSQQQQAQTGSSSVVGSPPQSSGVSQSSSSSSSGNTSSSNSSSTSNSAAGSGTGTGGNNAATDNRSSSGPPQNIQQLVASKRLQQAQAQVGEVVDIMRINVEKVLERDSKLSELDRRADDLQEGASQFQQQAVKLKRKLWWENAKMWIILGVLLLFFIAVLVLSTTSPGGQKLPREQHRNGTLETVDETGNPGPAFTTLHKIVITPTPPAFPRGPQEEKKKEAGQGSPTEAPERKKEGDIPNGQRNIEPGV